MEKNLWRYLKFYFIIFFFYFEKKNCPNFFFAFFRFCQSLNGLFKAFKRQENIFHEFFFKIKKKFEVQTAKYCYFTSQKYCKGD